MKVYVFDLLAYGRQFEEFKNDRLIPYPLPGKYFDRELAAKTYYEHLEVWREMDALGYDGVGLNEHHTTPHGLMNSPNMMAAVAAHAPLNSSAPRGNSMTTVEPSRKRPISSPFFSVTSWSS